MGSNNNNNNNEHGFDDTTFDPTDRSCYNTSIFDQSNQSASAAAAAQLDGNIESHQPQEDQQQQQQHETLPIFIENNVFCSQCSASFTPDKPLLRCSGCDLVWYCGPEHQQLDWYRHKDFCKQIQADKQRVQESMESQTSKQTNISGGPHGERRTVKQSDIAPAFVDQDSPLIHNESPCPPASQNAIINNTDGSTGHQGIGLDKIKRKISDTMVKCPSSTATGIDDDLPSTSSSSATGAGAVDEGSHLPSKRQKVASADQSPVIRKDHSLNRPYNRSIDEHVKACLASCPTMTRYQAFCSRIQDISSHVMKSLTEYGWCAVDNLLGDSHAASILSEIEALYKEDKFSLGPLMKQQAHPNQSARSKDIRSDYVLWFDNTTEEGSRAVNVNFLISMLDSILVQIASNMSSCKINGRSRAMMAVYPGSGSRYVKHVDNPVEDGRVITTIYYLNKDWVPTDGGSLRLYPESANSSIDVAPRFDRLFLFWSDKRNPHEVMPTFKHRYAVTVWYFDEKEKKRAHERQKRSRSSGTNNNTSSNKNEAHYQFPSPRPSSYVPPLPATNFSRLPSSATGISDQQQSTDGHGGGESIPGHSNLLTLIEAARATETQAQQQQQQLESNSSSHYYQDWMMDES